MGGIVVRLGDSSMSRLPKIDNVIDYPHTDCKSNLMDMYLIKYCKFYIATASGIFDAAILFGKEVLMTNSSCWIFPYALRIHDRTIIKHVYSKKHGRFLTLQERMSSDWSMQAIWSTIDKNYILFENSSDDIKNAVTEYLDIMHSGNFSLQECQLIANKKRTKKAREVFAKYRLGVTSVLSDEQEITQRYRIASRIDSSKGSISKCFVKKYWDSEFVPTDEDDIKKLEELRRLN